MKGILNHKQAILITAYKDLDHLHKLVNFFDNDFSVYIHLDRKSRFGEIDIKPIKSCEQVKLVSRKFRVNWAGRNHLKCYLHLAEEALQDKRNVYFHLISGQDFPVKELSYFKKFGTSQNRCDFLESFRLPAHIWDNENGGFDRVDYFHFFDLMDAKRHLKWLWRLVRLQKKIGLKRAYSNTLPPLYGGFTWWTLSRETLEYVLKYTKEDKRLLRRLKHTFCPEEIYFPTVIMNSPLAKKVVNDNLRYIDWSPPRVRKHSTSPAILDITDYKKIKAGNDLFARKFESPTSDQLLEKLISSIRDEDPFISN